MIPLLLDPAIARVAVVGRGAGALRRFQWLRRGGASPDVWSDAPSALLVAAAGDALRVGLPSQTQLSPYRAVWVVDLPHAEARPLAEAARAQGVLVNVEDEPPLCDFHTPAVVRRGKLTMAVGTGGASPAVARAVRERLETAFPDVWGEVLEEIGNARARLRARGESGETLARDARARLRQRGLM
jgi:precorrin-2 dehydrogenase/sirohydrochlorin ferrochelatase